MTRIYVRKFDHEEAREMRALGIPAKEIAARLGVSVGLIYKITRTDFSTKRGEWPRKTLGERAMSRIDVRGPGECWPWLGTLTSSGYGFILPNGSDSGLRAHRVVYELFIGPIPEGHDLDHLCHNRDLNCAGGVTCLHRRCCNPAHVEPVTRSENVARGAARRRAIRALESA